MRFNQSECMLYLNFVRKKQLQLEKKGKISPSKKQRFGSVGEIKANATAPMLCSVFTW